MTRQVDRIGTCLESVAKDHVVDIDGRNIRSLNRRDGSEDSEVCGAKSLQCAAELAKGRPSAG